jgi:hypothetical protein
VCFLESNGTAGKRDRVVSFCFSQLVGFELEVNKHWSELMEGRAGKETKKKIEKIEKIKKSDSDAGSRTPGC